MTTFASLVTDVYTLTNRPDLVNETALAVRAATLKMHHTDFYYKDVQESGVLFPTAEYQQSLPYKTLFPLWRSIKYIRKCDPSTTPPTPGDFLDLIVPETALDSYRISKENVYYIAGLEIQIRSLTLESNYIIAYYAHPNVVASTYSSWIADENPFAIIYEAAAIVYKGIGFDEQATAFRNTVTEEVALLKGGNLTAEEF